MVRMVRIARIVRKPVAVPRREVAVALCAALWLTALVALVGCGRAPSGSIGSNKAGRGLVGQVSSEPGKNADESPGSTQLDLSGKRIITREEVKPPAPAFNFTLIDQYGQRVSLGDLKGKLVLISFIYTNCPESCPMIPRQYLQIQQRFAEAIASGKLALVLITTDPEQDTPERLRRYTDRLGGKWLFLTGKLDEMQGVWRGYGVYREVKERLREVVVYHSYRTILIDGEGKVRFIYTGIWQPETVINDIAHLLGNY